MPDVGYNQNVIMNSPGFPAEAEEAGMQNTPPASLPEIGILCCS
jgi:hypothetical protein